MDVCFPRFLYQQYLMEKLGNYIEPGKSGLSYQIEYIIGKKNSDEANLKDVAKKLFDGSGRT